MRDNRRPRPFLTLSSTPHPCCLGDEFVKFQKKKDPNAFLLPSLMQFCDYALSPTMSQHKKMTRLASSLDRLRRIGQQRRLALPPVIGVADEKDASSDGGGWRPPNSFFLFAISNTMVLARRALPPPPLVGGTIFARVMTTAVEVTYGRGNVRWMKTEMAADGG